MLELLQLKVEKMRKCIRCLINKKNSDFYPDNMNSRFRQTYNICIECYKVRSKVNYELSKDKNRARNVLNAINGRAKAKNIKFSLVKEDIIYPKECPILGIPLVHGQAPHYNSPSIISLYTS